MTEKKVCRLVIVDDHQLVAEAWKTLLSDALHLQVTGIASHVEDVLSLVRRHKAELVLLDVNMEPVNGFEMTHILLKTFPDLKILAVSMYDHPEVVKKMMKAGALGYISKFVHKNEMLEAIDCILAGKKYISSDVKSKFAEDVLNDTGGDGNLAKRARLTEKELEIIMYVKQGLTSREIADKFGISFKTVQVHRHNILKKMNLKNTAALINAVVYDNIVA